MQHTYNTCAHTHPNAIACVVFNTHPGIEHVLLACIYSHTTYNHTQSHFTQTHTHTCIRPISCARCCSSLLGGRCCRCRCCCMLKPPVAPGKPPNCVLNTRDAWGWKAPALQGEWLVVRTKRAGEMRVQRGGVGCNQDTGAHTQLTKLVGQLMHPCTSHLCMCVYPTNTTASQPAHARTNTPTHAPTNQSHPSTHPKKALNISSGSNSSAPL